MRAWLFLRTAEVMWADTCGFRPKSKIDKELSKLVKVVTEVPTCARACARLYRICMLVRLYTLRGTWCRSMRWER